MIAEDQEDLVNMALLMKKFQHSATTGEDITLTADEVKGFMKASLAQLNRSKPGKIKDFDELADEINGKGQETPQPYHIGEPSYILLEPAKSKNVLQIEFFNDEDITELFTKVNDFLAQQSLHGTAPINFDYMENLGYFYHVLYTKEIPIAEGLE